jgi:hypothetical protein
MNQKYFLCIHQVRIVTNKVNQKTQTTETRTSTGLQAQLAFNLN